MPVRTITTTTTSRFVPGSNPDGFADDVSVTNTGTATAYIDSEQQTGTTAGYPLSAGSTVVWQAGRPLYVVSPTATTLTITENSGALFDAGAVASQILSQGLATQIAAQVAIAGAPPIDAPATLLDETWAHGGGVTFHTSATVTVTKYQSLTVRTITADTVRTLATGPATASQSGVVQIEHYANGVLIDNEEFGFFGDNQEPSYPKLARPVINTVARGDQVIILTRYGAAVTMRTIIEGSYRQRQSVKYFCGHGFWRSGGNGLPSNEGGASGHQSWNLSGMPIAATWSEWPRLFAGEASLLFDSGANLAAGSLSIVLTDFIAGASIWATLQTTAATRLIVYVPSIIVPPRPLVLTVVNGSGIILPATTRLVLTQSTTT